MNQNQIFIVPEQNENEIVVDTKDLFSRILLGWRTIISCCLVFAVLLVGFGTIRSKRSSVIDDLSRDERLSAAKEMLSEEEASDVETLYELSNVNREYQRNMQKKYADFLYRASQTEKARLLNISYYISSSFGKLDEVLPLTLFSDRDYRALDQIMTGDALSSYERLFIKMSSSSIESDPMNDTKAGENSKSRYLLLVTIYVDSEEQCNEAADIIDSTINRNISIIKEKDPQTILEMIGKDISCNTTQYVQSIVDLMTEQLAGADSKTKTLINNRVSALNQDQQYYYNMLKDESIQDTPSAESYVFYGKWIVVGGLIGFLFGVLIVALRYIFDGTVKTGEEADRLLRSKSLQTLFVPGKPNLFGRIAKKLLDADDSATERMLQLVSAEIASLAEKSKYQSVFAFYDSERICVQSAIEQMMRYMENHYPEIHIFAGDPGNAVSDLQNLSLSDSVIMLFELKHSKRKKLLRWKELCQRYDIPVIGNVPFETCW